MRGERFRAPLEFGRAPRCAQRSPGATHSSRIRCLLLKSPYLRSTPITTHYLLAAVLFPDSVRPHTVCAQRTAGTIHCPAFAACFSKDPYSDQRITTHHPLPADVHRRSISESAAL